MFWFWFHILATRTPCTNILGVTWSSQLSQQLGSQTLLLASAPPHNHWMSTRPRNYSPLRSEQGLFSRSTVGKIFHQKDVLFCDKRKMNILLVGFRFLRSWPFIQIQNLFLLVSLGFPTQARKSHDLFHISKCHEIKGLPVPDLKCWCIFVAKQPYAWPYATRTTINFIVISSLNFIYRIIWNLGIY